MSPTPRAPPPPPIQSQAQQEAHNVTSTVYGRIQADARARQHLQNAVTPHKDVQRRLSGHDLGWNQGFTDDPPAVACEAAGLRIAVRAWWRGTPGHGRGSVSAKRHLEDEWLRDVTAGGLQGGAKFALLNSGVPERVVEGGIQLSQFFFHDEGVRSTWARCQREKKTMAEFVNKAMECVLKRFRIRALPARPFGVPDTPSLVLTPLTGDGPPLATFTSSSPQRGGAAWETTRASSAPGWDGSTVVRGVPASTTVWEEIRPGLDGRRRHSPRGSLNGRTSAPLPELVFPRCCSSSSSTAGVGGTGTRLSPASDAVVGAGESGRRSAPPGAQRIGVGGEGTPGRMGSKPTAEGAPGRTGSKPNVTPKSGELAATWAPSTEVKSPGRATPRRQSYTPSNFYSWLKDRESCGDTTRKRGDGEYMVSRHHHHQLGDSAADANESLGTWRPAWESRKMVRDIAEVRRTFNSFDRNANGVIDHVEFLPLLSKLLRQPMASFNTAEVWKSWEATDANCDNKIHLDEFMNWYCRTFDVEFQDFSGFISDDIVPEREKLIREVARKLGEDNNQIEKIYQEFTKLDADGSGSLEYPEFEKLMIKAICPQKDSPGVPHKVLQKFWIDIDADGSGSVSFEEFASWYLKFFHGSISPMEQYYHTLGTGYRRLSLPISPRW